MVMVLLVEIEVVEGDGAPVIVCYKVDYEGMVLHFAADYFQSLINVLFLLNDLYLSVGQ